MRASSLCGSVLLLLTASCDQLTATMQAVSVLTKTPDLASAQGMDAALQNVLPLSDVQPEATLVAVGLAQKKSATSTAAPTPITGAKVFLAWQDQEVKVCEETDTKGAYAATSVPLDPCADPRLAYVERDKYITRIETGTDLYTMSTTPPAPVDATAVTFSPPLDATSTIGGTAVSVPHHSLGAELIVDWSADKAAAKRPTFAVVARINYTGGNLLDKASWQPDANNFVFDNTAKTPDDMRKLVTDEPESNVTIPTDTLNASGLYILVLTTAELSTDVSTNLALGSGSLAGAGVAFVFWVD